MAVVTKRLTKRQHLAAQEVSRLRELLAKRKAKVADAKDKLAAAEARAKR
jgi:hypothetical protein